MLEEVRERLIRAGYGSTVAASDYTFQDGSPGVWVTFRSGVGLSPSEIERDLVALHQAMSSWEDYLSVLVEPPVEWNSLLTHVGIFSVKRPSSEEP